MNGPVPPAAGWDVKCLCREGRGANKARPHPDIRSNIARVNKERRQRVAPRDVSSRTLSLSCRCFWVCAARCSACATTGCASVSKPPAVLCCLRGTDVTWWRSCVKAESRPGSGARVAFKIRGEWMRRGTLLNPKIIPDAMQNTLASRHFMVEYKRRTSMGVLTP